ncbi:hypothetical protein EDF64_12037 [Curtobacterium flaccumfaciens]|uniref:Uncharacterized protein n=1 Tax=Curtobacterium flaccumfaciens TaxID=2035 RepID=A0A4V6PQC7_9MICO|nr:hypothetical protein EDF64_12037 [Curtobacterium flaccumfaciens]
MAAAETSTLSIKPPATFALSRAVSVPSLRVFLDTAVRNRLGSRFPWGTSVINLTGSLALGIITGSVPLSCQRSG